MSVARLRASPVFALMVIRRSRYPSTPIYWGKIPPLTMLFSHGRAFHPFWLFRPTAPSPRGLRLLTSSPARAATWRRGRGGRAYGAAGRTPSVCAREPSLPSVRPC
jgi:hypothetical protein